MKLIFPIALLSLAAGCAVPTTDIMPRYGTFDIEGHFGVTSPPADPVPVADLAEAGFDKDDGYIGLRADIDVGSPVWYLSAQTTTHGGSGIVTNTLITDTGSITAGDAVVTDMDLGLYQAGVTFDFVPTDLVDVGLGFGITTVDLDAQMTDGTNTIDVDEVLPVPVIALRAAVDLGDFEAVGLVSGLELDIDGDEVSLFDLELLARYRLFGGDDHLAGSIGLGYRKLSFGVEYDDDNERIDTDFRMDGPYVTFVLTL